MSQPFDLNAVVTEAPEEPFVFTWGTEKFELPPLLAMPIDRQANIIDALAEIEEADDPRPTQILHILRLMIGDELLAQLGATKGGPDGRTTLSALQLMPLLREWMNRQGTQGKSAPSSRSSASTARQSKPISRSGRARRTS